ncbi:sugar ABC transporter permease [Streptomyces sp. TRM66268-LWL]|uniref:Sugar ABC transporter permease n=1 Tax=Streptomyces polyasparticus TaxID=2767826 RepID=A0ABR7SYK1_9ACTN|nr:sugar ABC transporter permease [Streptomyces polyasparticus]MBC9719443.1 sugar ABC transporter permease [Streptomyces polyasparticus]
MSVQTEARPVAVAAAPKPPPRKRWSRYRSRTFYAFVAPWLIGFLALTVVPMLYALRMSFTNTNGISDKARWVGIDNYVEALHDADVLHSLYRTGLFTLTVVPLTVLGSVLLALLVNQPIRGKGFFRTLFYLPAIVPGVAAALTWKLIFDKDAGPANGVMELLGLDPVTWLQDPAVSYVLLSLMLWGIGGGMLVSLAGLQDIPKELLEAARVDGAGKLRVFWHVTVPLLSPILLFQVVTGVINALQIIAQPMLLAPSAGGVVSAAKVSPDTNMYMVHVYAQYFTFGRWGYGSALLWLLFVVVLVITFLVMRLGRRVVFYNVDPDSQGEKG